jgi:hypothetical protein
MVPALAHLARLGFTAARAAGPKIVSFFGRGSKALKVSSAVSGRLVTIGARAIGSSKTFANAAMNTRAGNIVAATARKIPGLAAQLGAGTTKQKFTKLWNLANKAGNVAMVGMLGKEVLDVIHDDPELQEEADALRDMLAQMNEQIIISPDEMQELRETFGDEAVAALWAGAEGDVELGETVEPDQDLVIPSLSAFGVNPNKDPHHVNSELSQFAMMREGAAAYEREAEEAIRVANNVGGTRNLLRLHRLLSLPAHDLQVLLNED